MKILVANIGSTSYKFKLFSMPDEELLAQGKVEGIGSEKAPAEYHPLDGASVSEILDSPTYQEAISWTLDLISSPDGGALESWSELSCIGFKTIHAGPKSRQSHIISDALIDSMQAHVPLAPLHNPAYIKAIRFFMNKLENIPCIGVFEPSFHDTIPEYARIFGIPYDYSKQLGIEKYGFHGASHRFISGEIPRRLNRPADGLKIISCHLGGSSSLCAIRDGKSIDTTMAFSPQSGIIQSTRCGDLDPFVLPWLISQGGLDMTRALYRLGHEGGLLGISGISGDIPILEKAASEGNERARLALEKYVYDVQRYIGSLAVELDGADVIVFTGGIGERGVNMRKKICSKLNFMGVCLDENKNSSIPADGIISTDGSGVLVMVVPTNEEIVVAREAALCLKREE